MFSVTRVRVCFPTEQSNDVQSDLLTDTTHSHQRKNKKRVKQCWMPTTTNKKKAGKEMSAISGSRLSAPSASGSQSTTAPIFHMRRSWCGLLEWVSSLGSVCTVCVCVCGIIYGGTTQLCQHFNIWTPTPTSHCKSICGRNRRVSHSNPHSDIHTPAYLPAWTHNNAENIPELG